MQRAAAFSQTGAICLCTAASLVLIHVYHKRHPEKPNRDESASHSLAHQASGLKRQEPDPHRSQSSNPTETTTVQPSVRKGDRQDGEDSANDEDSSDSSEDDDGDNTGYRFDWRTPGTAIALLRKAEAQGKLTTAGRQYYAQREFARTAWEGETMREEDVEKYLHKCLNRPAARALEQKLSVAVHNGHHQTVQQLIEEGADVDRAGSTGLTPLLLAVLGGHHQTVRVLVKCGVDVNRAQHNGCTRMIGVHTPLLLAALGGHHQVAQLLIEAGADVNRADNSGLTPLQAAAHRGEFGIVNLLIHSAADAKVAPSERLLRILLRNQEAVESQIQQMIRDGVRGAFEEFKRLLLTTPTARSGINWLVHLAMHHNEEEVAETAQRSLVWSPDSHRLFPLAFRKGVEEVYRLRFALDRKDLVCAFSNMDIDLWHMIIGRLGRDWQFDK